MLEWGIELASSPTRDRGCSHWAVLAMLLEGGFCASWSMSRNREGPYTVKLPDDDGEVPDDEARGEAQLLLSGAWKLEGN